MPALVRCILAVIAGVLVGVVTVTITDKIVHKLYPLPPGVDPNDQAFLARIGRRLAAWFGEIF